MALGLLAGLLVSVTGLLALGGRQVGAGARASHALAVAQAVLEDLDLRAYRRTYSDLGCDGTLPACRVTSGQPATRAWDPLARASLPGGGLEVSVVAVGATSLDAAPALRIAVTVTWPEGSRIRRLRLTTLRV
jgi:hypothetical protein